MRYAFQKVKVGDKVRIKVFGGTKELTVVEKNKGGELVLSDGGIAYSSDIVAINGEAR